MKKSVNKEVRDANNIIHTATAVNEGPLFMVNLGRGLDKAEAGRMEKRLNSSPEAIETITTGKCNDKMIERSGTSVQPKVEACS